MFLFVLVVGLEPTTPCSQSRCASQLRYTPITLNSLTFSKTEIKVIIKGYNKNMNFYAQVYKITAKIPKGRVATYGQIASLISTPRAARMVGWALHLVNRQPELPPQAPVRNASRGDAGESEAGEDQPL